MVFVFGAIPFIDAMIVQYVDDRMRPRVAGMRLAVSFGVSALTFSFTPGRLMPLFDPISPPVTTRQWTMPPLLSIARSSTRPSSMRILSPGFTSLARVSQVVGSVPGT